MNLESTEFRTRIFLLANKSAIVRKFGRRVFASKKKKKAVRLENERMMRIKNTRTIGGGVVAYIVS